MTQGTITRLVHLANQPDLPSANITSQRNFAGYGYIEWSGGEPIFFEHSVVSGRPFKHLEEGDQVEFEVDEKEQKKAVAVYVRE